MNNSINQTIAGKMTKIMDIFFNRTIMNAFLVVLAILSILLFIFPVEVDLTRNGSNSISRESSIIIKSMDVKDDELKVMYFSAITNSEIDTNALERITTVFNQFQKYNSKISYEIIDLASNAEALTKYPNADTKCILITYKDKEICIPFETFAKKADDVLEISVESVLIDEFIKLKDLSNYDIYYTYTHGEKFDSEEFADFNLLLKRLGYNAIKADLANPLPEDVSTLYVIAPREDFTLEEAERLKNYVSSGNSLFLSLATTSSKEQSGRLVEYPNLKALCHELGINILDSVIVDQIQDTKLIGVYSEEDEEAMKLEPLNPIVYMPSSRMMNVNETSESYKVTRTMMSGELASYPLVVKLEKENTKVLVSATPDLFNNSYITGNKIFGTYLIKWVDNFKTNTDIKSFEYREYKADATQFRPALILGIIEIMIPGLALYIGFEISRKRVMAIKSKTMK